MLIKDLVLIMAPINYLVLQGLPDTFWEYQLVFCYLAFAVTALLKTPGLVAYLIVFFVHTVVNTFDGIYLGQVTFVFTTSVISVLIFDRKQFFHVLAGLIGVLGVSAGILFVLNIIFGNGNQLTDFSRWAAMIMLFFSIWGASFGVGKYFLSEVKILKKMNSVGFGFLLGILPILLMFFVYSYVPLIHENYVIRHRDYLSRLP